MDRRDAVIGTGPTLGIERSGSDTQDTGTDFGQAKFEWNYWGTILHFLLNTLC